MQRFSLIAIMERATGFEPAHDGLGSHCLTTWRCPHKSWLALVQTNLSAYNATTTVLYHARTHEHNTRTTSTRHYPYALRITSLTSCATCFTCLSSIFSGTSSLVPRNAGRPFASSPISVSERTELRIASVASVCA